MTEHRTPYTASLPGVPSNDGTPKPAAPAAAAEHRTPSAPSDDGKPAEPACPAAEHRTPNSEPVVEPRRKVTLTGALQTRFNTEAGRRYDCALIAAGELQGHELFVGPATLKAAIPLFENAGAFMDHSMWGPKKLDRFLGRFDMVQFNPRTDAIHAELALWDTPAAEWAERLIDRLIDEQNAGTPTADIGLSADCWIEVGPDQLSNGLYPITRIVDVESVDMVFRPASDGARFRKILAQVGDIRPPHPPEEINMPDEPTAIATDQPAKLSSAQPLSSAEPPAPAVTAEPAPIGSGGALRAFGAALLDVRLQATDLPQPFRMAARRELADCPLSPEAIDRAIQSQHTLHASLIEGSVIQGFGQPLDAGNLTSPLDVAANAMKWLFGVRSATLPEPELRSASAIYQALTGDHNWHGQFSAERARFARASTSTLADLATDAMNIIMAEQWEALSTYHWFEQLVTVAPHDGSLADMNWVSFGGIANLPSVAEGQTYSELNVADAKETDSFTKYGGYVGITEEMFRKNQMLKLQGIPRALAASAIRTRSYYISYIFSQASGTGPTLDEDSVVLFHSGSHSNHATTAFSVSAWAAARTELFEQTQLGSSKPLGIFPKFLLVPIELYDTALVTFGYGAGPGGYPGTADNDVNPYAQNRQSDPRPIIVAVPEWTDANNWYYLADPNVQPVIFMSYAQQPGGGSHPMPELFTVTSPTAGLIFTNDTLPIKVRDWFAYGVAGYRGVGGRVVA